jgi:23S rRNA pseudouridine1911/1915/1917 synthase
MANLEISRGKRLDQYVIEAYPKLSRAYAKKLCDDGSVTVNGRVEKAGYKLRANDEVTVTYDQTVIETIPDIDLPILYEDADCLVINKPVGVLTHSKGGFTPEGTVASFIRARTEEMSGDRAGIVHRLDRATSGIIICAKNSEALAWMQKQFSQRKVKKTYRAIVTGHLKPLEAIIDMPIERNPKAPATFRVGENGKSATTHYKVLESAKGYDLVELYPTTGRTHQLRVHMKQVGHPIVGDLVYGGEPTKRLYLHALSLEITLPNRERVTFEAPMPSEFNTFITRAHG